MFKRTMVGLVIFISLIFVGCGNKTTNEKVQEARIILGQIVNLEKTFKLMNDEFVEFYEGEDCNIIGFTRPITVNDNPAGTGNFIYRFEIKGEYPNFTGSVATATEITDVNGDGDISDGLTLTVDDIQDGFGGLKW